MEYGEMKELVHTYNWDDGFDIPEKIISDANCDLALALEVFYLGDGFGYFQTFAHNIGGTKDWFSFISKLYEGIVQGRYKKTDNHFVIPISKVQRYQLRKNNIPEVFLTDL